MRHLSKYNLGFAKLGPVVCGAAPILFIFLLASCGQPKAHHTMHNRPASELLGNPKYPAICFGGYRGMSRSEQPTIAQLKDDLRILHALGIRFIRTYNVQLPHAENVVRAVHEMKQENPGFEMYVMLGAWIDCAGAWTDAPNHAEEDFEANEAEIERAVALVQKYPEIIKVVAVGNEAMVHWAASYFVAPQVILRWVNYLQSLKETGNLPADLWITSSDNFASWGGGEDAYHNDDLNALIRAVDYVSMHTYPFHDTHYNPGFWKASDGDIEQAMERALAYSKNQYDQVVKYVHQVDPDKPVHIGETGWASISDGFYGPEGSRAADEYKQALFYNGMRDWTQNIGISCFYFEAFDEPWKSAGNPTDSENHFGLFTVNGEAKHALWPHVLDGVFEGLSRDGSAIVSSYEGKRELLNRHVLQPAP